jgi:hypothetical protein
MFNKIVVVRDYPSRWACVRIKVEYFSTGPLSLTNNEWTKNNQYSFTLIKPTFIRLVLRQIWSGVLSVNEDDLFGFLLFTSPDGSTTVSCMKLDCLVAKVKSNDENEASHCG